MAQSYEFYCARADEAAAAAKAAQLDRVRERELRAEKTWRGLAEHARAVAEERAKLVRDKAAEAEAATVAADGQPA
ncbi:MAG: hypothetical protein GW855_13455 [Erythrobacter sp.]|nr:hypothetical protein [Erythrobacter sp.]NCQ64977.1 hypothetical protein [Alphaproteobacteria bacterium]